MRLHGKLCCLAEAFHRNSVVSKAILAGWAAVLFGAGMCGFACAAPPDFSTSNAIHEPVPAVAGDVLHYTVTVTNTGGDSSYARIKTTLPQGYFIRADGDCAAAVRDQDSNELVWHEGGFSGESTKQCQIDFLSRREAAGTLAALVTEITTVPSGYLSFETVPELAAQIDSDAVPIGPVSVTQAGVVVLTFLATVIVSATIVARMVRRGQRWPTLRAWFTVAIAVGFLLHFVGLAAGDVRTYAAYRETSCTIFGSAVLAYQGTGRSTRSSTYASVFAVRYEALGTEAYSSAFPPTTAVNLGWIGLLQQKPEHRDGSVHPCWFDPDDVKSVLLERGPGAAYLFALLPLLVLAYGLSMLVAAFRKTRSNAL